MPWSWHTAPWAWLWAFLSAEELPPARRFLVWAWLKEVSKRGGVEAAGAESGWQEMDGGNWAMRQMGLRGVGVDVGKFSGKQGIMERQKKVGVCTNFCKSQRCYT